MTISNPRGLVVQLLGELLYVERRLTDDVLPSLVRDVRDDGLRIGLEQHLEATRAHPERIETVFRKLEVAPTSNRVSAFESAVGHSRELADACVEDRLRDFVHAQAAHHTEHWELAAYRTVLALLPVELGKELRPSLADEKKAASVLAEAIEALAGPSPVTSR